jgi:hypothetical protein
VTYTWKMLRLLLLVVPFVVLAGVAVLLNQVDAAPGTGFAALCVVSVLTGIGIGLFAGRHRGSHGQDRVAIASRRAIRAGR